MNHKLGFEFVGSKNIIIQTGKQNLNLPFKTVVTAITGNFMMTGAVVDNNRDLCFQKQVLKSLWESL